MALFLDQKVTFENKLTHNLRNTWASIILKSFLFCQKYENNENKKVKHLKMEGSCRSYMNSWMESGL